MAACVAWIFIVRGELFFFAALISWVEADGKVCIRTDKKFAYNIYSNCLSVGGCLVTWRNLGLITLHWNLFPVTKPRLCSDLGNRNTLCNCHAGSAKLCFRYAHLTLSKTDVHSKFPSTTEIQTTTACWFCRLPTKHQPARSIYANKTVAACWTASPSFARDYDLWRASRRVDLARKAAAVLGVCLTWSPCEQSRTDVIARERTKCA